MRLLSNFLQKTSAMVHLYESQVFQMFIRNAKDFEVGVKSLKPLTNLDLYLSFKENFPIENSFEYSEQTEIYVMQIVYYLKNSLEKIRRMKATVKRNIENFHTMKYNLCKLMAGIKELTPVFRRNEEVVFNVKRKRYQMYQVLLDWARSEILDIEAIIEGIMKMKEITEHFKVKNDNTLQNLIEENIESNQMKTQIVTMVQHRLVLYEIPRFRESKAAKWEMVLKAFISTGRLEMQNVQDIVQEIDKNFNS
jgi:hypothetical protein